MIRRNHCYCTRFSIGIADDSAHTAIMVAMAVAIDDGFNRARAQLLVDQFQGSSSSLSRCQRIDQYPARVAFDDSHVRDIETPHLPNIVRNFVQAMLTQQFHMPPQAWVDRWWCRAIDPVIGPQVPNGVSIFCGDDGVRSGSNKALVGKSFVAAVLGRERCSHKFLRFNCRSTCGLCICCRISGERGAGCSQQHWYKIAHHILPLFRDAIRQDATGKGLFLS